MANEQNPIDELFRSGLKDGGITPPPGVWEAVSAGMPAAAPGMATVIIKSIWTWVTVGAIGLGAVAAVLSSDKDEVHVQTEKTSKLQTQEKKVASELQTEAEIDALKVTNGASANSELGDSPESQKQQVYEQQESNDKSGNASGNKLVEGSSFNNQLTPVQPNPEKQNQRLVVEEQNAAVNEPCGRNVKISSTMAAGQNRWTFTLPGTPAGSYQSWNFGDGETGSGNPVEHIFPDLDAEYEVKVLIFRAAGCMDSGSSRVVTRQRHPGVSVPDVFTPNGDGLNEELVITMPEVVLFNLVVTDRNGKQVFVSNQPIMSWNGKCAAMECPSGSYRVTITYKTPSSRQAIVYTKTVLLKR